MRSQMPAHSERHEAFPNSWNRASRPLILGVAERSVGRDERLGAIFTQMRSVVGSSVEDVAQLIGARPELIRLLESGDLRGLPSWQETQDVVTRYARWVNVDPHPLLERMHDQLLGARGDIGAVETATPGTSVNQRRASPSVAPPEARDAVQQNRRAGRRRRSRQRALLAFTAPLLACAAAVYLAHARPAPVMTTLHALPASIERPVLGALDLILHHTSPRRDGLVWIEVADPQSRKSDRLTAPVR